MIDDEAGGAKEFKQGWVYLMTSTRSYVSTTFFVNQALTGKY